ncbi:hypothetical protein BURK2_03825 [Burkholderiales bacterium]|nr:MAG: STAS domain-containing protein [Burkholderiales bacterium]CAG1009033.1 hypothetical protein BURK2_03825 [Burkholderiales bacterium]
MGLQLSYTGGICQMRIDGEMTIASARSLRDEILASIPGDPQCEVEVDLSGVSEIDTTGLQLMLSLKQRCGTRLRMVHHSPAVLRILDLSNASAHLGDPLVILAKEPPAR